MPGLPGRSFCRFLSVGDFVVPLFCLAFFWLAFVEHSRGRHGARGPCSELYIHCLTSAFQRPLKPVQSLSPCTTEEETEGR